MATAVEATARSGATHGQRQIRGVCTIGSACEFVGPGPGARRRIGRWLIPVPCGADVVELAVSIGFSGVVRLNRPGAETFELAMGSADRRHGIPIEIALPTSCRSSTQAATIEHLLGHTCGIHAFARDDPSIRREPWNPRPYAWSSSTDRCTEVISETWPADTAQLRRSTIVTMTTDSADGQPVAGCRARSSSRQRVRSMNHHPRR
jgi:hypothetical protein